jgi:uncharacterized protein (DUF305 family)
MYIQILLMTAIVSLMSSAGENHALLNRPDDCWQQFRAGMLRMHKATAQLKSSGHSDADFVRMMIPHHQAAIDMAKTELLCGRDPQVRRLAQEIITDQQQEIVLMQRWREKESLK